MGGPPPRPFPQVSAEIGSLEESREIFETASLGKVQRAFNLALDNARSRIGELIGHTMLSFDDPRLTEMRQTRFTQHVAKRASSFLAIGQTPEETVSAYGDKLSVKVRVSPIAPPGPSLKPKIDVIEHNRMDNEKHMIDQAVAEMDGLTDVVLNELQAQIQVQLDNFMDHAVGKMLSKRSSHAVGFIKRDEHTSSRSEDLPKQANVRVVASDIAYPTISSMVQDMETRRDLSEDLERGIVLQKQLSLLKAENEMIREALPRAIQRILAQYSSVIQNNEH